MITPEKLLEMATNLDNVQGDTTENVRNDILEEKLTSAALRMENQGIKEARFFEEFGEDLAPFQKGCRIKIKKGSVIHTMKGEQIAKRDYTVLIHRVYPGFSPCHNFNPANLNSRNPMVVWSGATGWHETDLNNVELV